MTNTKMIFHVQTALQADGTGTSLALCKQAALSIDTDMAGNAEYFNPAELLMAALSDCIIKGIRRVQPILNFQLRGIEVRLEGVRQDVPPKMESISYEIIVDTDESEARLKLLHDNVQKFGTVFNTLAAGTELQGVLRRKTIE